jgi:hypothetical protein
MKEITIERFLDKIFKKQDTCTASDINKAVDEYRKKHPDVYVERDRDSINYLMSINKDKYYDDFENRVFRKQEVVICHCCGTKLRKFPDIKQFVKVTKNNNLHKMRSRRSWKWSDGKIENEYGMETN